MKPPSPPSALPSAPARYATILTFFFISLAVTLPTFTTALSNSTTAPPPHISPSPPAAPSPKPPPAHTSTSPLDPKQLKAFKSLAIPSYRDPCAQPSLHNATVCDGASPFRHFIALKFLNCTDEVPLTGTGLKSLDTVEDLQFINCPIPTAPIDFPVNFALSLRSFVAINSLRKLTAAWLGKLKNVTFLRVANVAVFTNHPYVIFGEMKELRSVTISNASMNGTIPEHWHSNLTYIDFSKNMLKGRIPDSITLLEELEVLNLSSNELTGEIPVMIGDLFSLVNLSLASNQLSGSIPETLAAIKTLVHIDLSSNKFNGTIPHFISMLDGLKYLNLANNEFHGVMPFNESFVKKLAVFKVDGNDKLCYNHSSFTAKMRMGIAPCDKHGLPVSPPPAKESPDDGGDDGGSSNDDYSDGDPGDSRHKDDHHHGPSKIVLGVAIGLASIVFIVLFLICLSKWCH